MTFPWLVEPLNQPFGDPGFRLEHCFSRTALFFDLGDLHALSNRQILRASLIFISHGHIDHLIGFDHLLRLNLNRSRHLQVFGPPGIITLLGHKLAGYQWNLVSDYELRISVSEIDEHEIRQTVFVCRHRFQPETLIRQTINDHLILQTPTFRVKAVLTDHDIPCLAFALEEPLQIKFRPEALASQGWTPGPWLTRIRELLQSQAAGETIIRLGEKSFTLQEIAASIAITRPGQKISYVADTSFTPANLETLLPLIRHSDLLLCEAAFLDSATAKAAASRHLTSGQAGRLAQLAGVRRLRLFHFSPRHSGQQSEFYQQAAAYYSGPIV
ncbi:MAG TPA: ribonuclease Z [Proteobacteria bacterium]|nr:ribonuclease Z [Pseudomonadota bacterium]